jgi:hypothetical protein
VVATSTRMREGRSARAHSIAEPIETSPDWMPWVISGRSAARLAYGLAMLPAAVIATDDATLVKNRRRVSDAALRAMTAIGPPPSNHRGGSCPRRLTDARHFDDGYVTPRFSSGHKCATDIAVSSESHRFSVSERG